MTLLEGNTTTTGGTTSGGASGGTGTGTGVSDAGNGGAAAGGTSSGGSSGSAPGSGGGTSGSTPSWRDSLPDDLKSDPSLAQFSDVTNLAKSYVHTKSLAGKKGIVPPTDKSTDEEWTQFFDTVGRPALDKYEIKKPEGKNIDEKFLGKFKESAHKAGLLPKQAQAVFEMYIGEEEAAMAMMKTNHELSIKEGNDKLKKEWGEGFDKQIALAKMAVKEVKIDGFSEFLEQTGMKSNPTMIKLMAKVGALFGEDKIVGEDAGRFGGQTRDQIQAEIDTVFGNKSDPYWDSTHAGHSRAVKQMEQRWQKMSS